MPDENRAADEVVNDKPQDNSSQEKRRPGAPGKSLNWIEARSSSRSDSSLPSNAGNCIGPRKSWRGRVASPVPRLAVSNGTRVILW